MHTSSRQRKKVGIKPFKKKFLHNFYSEKKFRQSFELKKKFLQGKFPLPPPRISNGPSLINMADCKEYIGVY
jgi:hypothetical protein